MTRRSGIAIAALVTILAVVAAATVYAALVGPGEFMSTAREAFGLDGGDDSEAAPVTRDTTDAVEEEGAGPDDAGSDDAGFDDTFDTGNEPSPLAVEG